MTVVRRVAVLLTFAILAAGPTSSLGQGASPLSDAGPGRNAAGHDRARANTDPAAHHSLRQPVTDQNFYFVMADRFNNGAAANDNGGLPAGTGEGQSGFDPTGKGWYHGGDLKGLTDKLDYIKGLGTTASRTRRYSRRTTPPATTATGSPTSPTSTRTWAPTRSSAPW
jgi:alpha-amylase